MTVNARDLQHIMGNLPAEDIVQAERDASVALRGFLDASNQLHDLQRLFAEQAAAQFEMMRRSIAHDASRTVNEHSFPALQITEMINSISLPTVEASGLDEVLRLMSRLSAPDVDRMVLEIQNEWRARDEWEPIGDVELQPDTPHDAGELIEQASRVGAFHDRLMNAVVRGIGQVTEQERSVVELVTYLALWTGQWLPAIFFVLEVLRQRAQAARAVIEHEGMSFDVDLEWDTDEQVWVTNVPALNGTSAFGPTRDVALKETADAIRGYVRAARTLGLPLPDPEPTAASHRTGLRPRRATTLSTA